MTLIVISIKRIRAIHRCQQTCGCGAKCIQQIGSHQFSKSLTSSNQVWKLKPAWHIAYLVPKDFLSMAPIHFDKWRAVVFLDWLVVAQQLAATKNVLQNKSELGEIHLPCELTPLRSLPCEPHTPPNIPAIPWIPLEYVWDDDFE